VKVGAMTSIDASTSGQTAEKTLPRKDPRLKLRWPDRARWPDNAWYSYKKYKVFLRKAPFNGTFCLVASSNPMRADNKMLQLEVNMNFKTKLAILLVATLITLVGFNLIASSPALDLMKVGKQAGYNIIANVLAESNSSLHRI
jgi:hypothetical protein